jgi:leader peptidase (prepilin peptidase)/N-methyltransferase
VGDETRSAGQVPSTPERRGRLRLVALGAVTVALAAAVAVAQSSVAASVLRGLLVLALVPCAVIDLDRRIIPNRITGPGALLALCAGLALDPGGELTRVLSALAAGGFLLVASLLRPSGMGMGDVKLTGMMGLFLGTAVSVALFAALIASVLTGVALATRRGVTAARKTALPFGPYLAFGGILAALVGNHIVHAYLHSVHH